jgi:hypothetical protein
VGSDDDSQGSQRQQELNVARDDAGHVTRE